MLDVAAVSYRIVLTKVDKVSPTHLRDLQKNIQETLKKHAAAYPQICLTSTVKKIGVAELRAEIAQFAIGSPQ